MAIIKTSLLLLSCAGWMLWGRDKAPKYIRLEFIPSLFCAYTSIIMLCAGLLNILPLCSYLYFISGLFLFFKHAHIYKQEFLFIPAFGLSLIYMYFHLDGNIILHYDDLNFWGTVVKVMLANDRLPNFQDTFLYHTSYPLGSSLFIYYFCRLTNSSDSMMMWSQQFMQLSFLFSLTASINRKNALPATIGFFSYLIFATVSLISPYELLVDSLLPIAAVSTIHMIHFFKTKPYTALFCALPMFTLLLTIKNSGFFFFSISLLFLIYYSHDYFKEHIHLSSLLCITVAIFYIWNRHVDYAFSPTSISRHNISPSHLLSVYSQKSYSEIFYIISSYISKLLQI